MSVDGGVVGGLADGLGGGSAKTKKSLRDQLEEKGAIIPEELDVDSLVRDANQKYGNNLDIDELLKRNGVKIPPNVTFSASSRSKTDGGSSGSSSGGSATVNDGSISADGSGSSGK